MIGGVVQAVCRNGGKGLLQVDGWMRQDWWPEIFVRN